MRCHQTLTWLSRWISRTPALRIAGAAVLVSIANCKPEDALPGTALGSLAVTAVLSSNTCGSGLDPTNPWKFDAELSLDGNTLYFRANDEEEVSAPLDSENSATCTSVVNSQSSTDSACTLSLKTIYTIKLAATRWRATGWGATAWWRWRWREQEVESIGGRERPRRHERRRHGLRSGKGDLCANALPVESDRQGSSKPRRVFQQCDLSQFSDALYRRAKGKGMSS